MCSQLHGKVFTDSRGEPLSNLTIWQDQRVRMTHPSGKGSYFEVMLQRISSNKCVSSGTRHVPYAHPS
jgi:hypothetical protein